MLTVTSTLFGVHSVHKLTCPHRCAPHADGTTGMAKVGVVKREFSKSGTLEYDGSRRWRAAGGQRGAFSGEGAPVFVGDPVECNAIAMQ